MVLDPVLLSQCPALLYVNTADRTTTYRCEDIGPWYLQGWTALTSNTATLVSILKLSSF
jgi:hypothetical protein